MPRLNDGPCSIEGCGLPAHCRTWCKKHYWRWSKYGTTDDEALVCRKGDLLYQLGNKFLVGDGCWEWIATLNQSGYGQIRIKGRAFLAHRVVYELMKGPIPEGLTLDHLCRNPACVRPDHLEPVTQRENNLRGQSPAAHHARKTHCPQGHEYTPENTYRRPRGKFERQCLTCMTTRNRARSQKGK